MSFMVVWYIAGGICWFATAIRFWHMAVKEIPLSGFDWAIIVFACIFAGVSIIKEAVSEARGLDE